MGTIKKIILITVLWWSFLPVAFALTVIEDFNSYTDGDLAGQGGWSGSANFDVEGTTVQEGAKAVQNTTAGSVSIINTFTAVDNGIISWYVQKSNTNTYDTYVRFANTDSDVNGGAYLAETGKVKFMSDIGETVGDAYSANTWVHIEMQIDGTLDKVRYRVDGGTWTDWLAVASNTGWSELLLKKQNQTNNSYWDNFTFTPNAVPTTAKKSANIIIFE